MKMKVEFSGLMNGMIPVTQVIEVDEFDGSNVGIVLNSLLSGFKYQGFEFTTNVTTMLYKAMCETKAGTKYKKLVDVNEKYAGIRIYCKNDK